MGSFADTAEARIIEAAIPSIQKLCKGRWDKLEYQDRVSEVCRIFLEDLRTMPLNTGHFLEEFRADLEVKMGELNRRTPSLRFDHCSLDAVFSSKTGETFEGYCLIPSTADFSRPEVDDFLQSLPLRARKLLLLRMRGHEPPEMAEMFGVSISQIEREMEELQCLFKLWNEE